MHNARNCSKSFDCLKLKSIMLKYGIENLMEYTLDSQAGCRLDLLYKEILEEFLNTRVHVAGDEISDGKCRLKFFINEHSFCMTSKASYTIENMLESLMDFVICPFMNLNSGFRRVCG